MVYEYEFRLLKLVDTLQEALDVLPAVRDTYTVFYSDSFRIKGNCCELKTVEKRTAMFRGGQWFQYTECREKPMSEWRTSDFRQFRRGFGLKPVLFEHRFECLLSPDVKLYAFHRPTTGVCGIVLEIEMAKSDTPLQPWPLHKSPFFSLRLPGRYPPSAFKKCRRKPVTTALRVHGRYLKARKHDGVFGFVYVDDHRATEIWEDHVTRRGEGFGLGYSVVFAAERTEDVVVLLDAYQVNGCPTFRQDVRHVLRRFLPSLTSLPDRYTTQVYAKADEPLDAADELVVHTFDDRLYKFKPTHTLDLWYEDGEFLMDGDRKIPFSESLDSGKVYEVTMKRNRIVSVLRERPDRYWGNTAKQITRIVDVSRILD